MVLIEIYDDQNFVENITKGKALVIIHKHNCSFCKIGLPIFEELSEKYPHIKFLSAENEKIPKILDKFNVTMYPTFISIENGKIIEVFYGETIQEKLEGFVKRNLN